MRARVSAQSHLEYRPSGYHWRRRWPRRVLRRCTPRKKTSLLFSLRSHVLPDAQALAQKLSLLSDIAFAGVTERTMAIAPDIMERLLVKLCRFLIEAADAAREMAPTRTPEVAAYDLVCATAAVDTLRYAIATRDREVARNPLRDVAARLGITLDERDPDWQRLAYRALRVMLDAEQENVRRDRGEFDGPSGTLQAARDLVDSPAPVSALLATSRTDLMRPLTCHPPRVAPETGQDAENSEASPRTSPPTQAKSDPARKVVAEVVPNSRTGLRRC